jgi:hypothetical protein
MQHKLNSGHGKNIMRVLLHNSETGLYLAGPSRWTEDRLQALDFESVDHAVTAYKEARISFAEIMVEEGPSLGGASVPLPDEPRKGLTPWF